MNDIVYAGKHTVTYRVPRHEHDTWELIYCTGQGGELQFDDFTLPYEVGTVVVIPPHTPHANVSQIGFTNIYVNLTNATLNFHRPAVVQDDGNRSLLSVFSGVFFQYYGNAEQRETLLAAYGNLLVAYLLAYRKASSLSKIAQEIEGHIVRHYADPGYALDDYLKSLPYNYDYLRKLFQKDYCHWRSTGRNEPSAVYLVRYDFTEDGGIEYKLYGSYVDDPPEYVDD